MPDVKLRAMVNFPARVTGGTAIDIEKASGAFTINFDVSGLVQNPNISEAEVGQCWSLVWNKTTNAYEMVPFSLSATSGVSSIDSKTGALDLGDGLEFTGDTLDLTPFTQDGINAHPISFDEIFRGKIYRPEMFTNSVISAPLQTAAVSVPDASVAIQRAIDALASIGGGVVELGPRVYGANNIVVPANVYIKGQGMYSTVLLHKPTANGSCLFFGSGTVVETFKSGVSDLCIASADTTFKKIGMNVYDFSAYLQRNVAVAGYPLNNNLYYTGGPGAGSIGLLVQGREYGDIYNFDSAADQPLRVSINPNSTTISLDSWVFRDFAGYCGVATNSVITFDTGVVCTNNRFGGRQNWIGGLHGFNWIDTSSPAISQILHLSGFKCEQATNAAGYSINIQHNTTLYGLHIADGMMGDRNGVLLRKVHNTKLDSIYYDAAGGPNNIGLNATTSCGIIEISSSAWQSDTTRSTPGLTLSDSTFIAGFSTDLPSRGIFKV
jgi:hypothetical protein